MADSEASRIKYALHAPAWNAETQSVAVLRGTATKVLAADCTEAMRGHLYCPACSTGLTRVPKDKLFFANGRRACFAHLPRNRFVPCDLRSTKPEGKLYNSQEEAALAVASDELVVVNEFLDAPMGPASVGEYDQTPVEDASGPVSDIPIARHRGQTFRLPTRVSTVASICRSFDENLYRYYFFPGAKSAVRLIDALTNIASVTEPTDVPALYYGRIIGSRNAGRIPKPTNIRMTELHANSSVKDFYIKVVDKIQAEKGITDESAGRYVLFWGRIVESGIGLGVEQLKWGELALLPAKYEPLLEGETAQ